MNLISPGLQRFVLFNPATGDKVSIDGNFIAPGSEVERSQLTRGVNARGGINVVNDRWETTINFADAEAYQALAALPRGRHYQYVAIGFDKNVLHYENQAFSLAENAEFNPESEEYPYTLNIVHVGPQPDIRALVNLAAPWRAGQSGVAEGYQTSASASFANGVQTIGHGSDFSLLRNLILPAEGLQFTLAVDWLALHDDGNNASVLRWRDFSGAIIRSDEITVGAPGSYFDMFVAPENAWSVDVLPIRVTSVSDNLSDAQIANPVMRNFGTKFINA